jgi:hypothetical protein
MGLFRIPGYADFGLGMGGVCVSTLPHVGVW